jgi:hypothetical protein
VIAIAGCGAGTHTATTAPKLPSDYRPIPIGRGSGYRLPAVSPAVARRLPINGLRCTRGRPAAYGIHLELYGRGLVVPVPAGIGIAPPQQRDGAYVRGGACWYPLRTYEPTGVVVVDEGHTPTLGKLFDVWGQPLRSNRLAGFRGPVTAFVAGRRWTGAPREIPLSRHAQIVLVRGGNVVPHPAYRFPPGL